jgi:transposase
LSRWRIGWGGNSCFDHARIGGGKDMDETQRFRWFLGIDVSKETFDASCINTKGEKLFSLSTSMSRKGFEELIKELSSLSIPAESVLIGVESTACYHVNLYSFLVSLGYCVMVINPLLISNFVKLQLRKTKTDKKDAYVIAQFLLLHRDSLSQSTVSSELSEIFPDNGRALWIR